MPLPLSDARSNAVAFAAEWREVTSERAESQTFWTELFAVFGVKRRSVASFEARVRNLGRGFDRIDVFYAGVMLGEHKSRGESLTKAASQAFAYVQLLTRDDRNDEVPRFIVISDFAHIVVYDLESAEPSRPVASFPTSGLPENVQHLGFIAGYGMKPLDPEDPVNIRAVEVLGQLHDTLETGGYAGHSLERFLVRVLFCLFADDTGIFEPDTFKALVQRSRLDGSDLGPTLARMFEVLDTPEDQRPKNLPDALSGLPHVNGALFAENLGFADFTASMRTALLSCCTKFNWSRISPAVFGSLFQSIMAGEAGRRKRRQIGAHYTSERNILRLMRSLFLDELEADLESCRGKPKRLREFHGRLSRLRLLDPACGCGNFLVVSYRELRRLEMEVLAELYGGRIDSRVLLLEGLLKVDVDQMHGIELDEWPARIAEVAMWLVDHQMNQQAGERFGQPVLRLPLKKGAKIRVGNALRIDWNDVVAATECNYVLGNPPFVGAMHMSADQRADLDAAAGGGGGTGVLDYVAGWYLRAAQYARGAAVRCAFVSTSSITQGEQVGILWEHLFGTYAVKIHFAHRTFPWTSEARGRASVHVVIIGFGTRDRTPKLLVEYDERGEVGTQSKVSKGYRVGAVRARGLSRPTRSQ